MTAQLLAAWLWVNLIPFSTIGTMLVIAGHCYDRVDTPQSRRVFAMLVAALIACVWLTWAVVFDQCSVTSGIWWWLEGCYLRSVAVHLLEALR